MAGKSRQPVRPRTTSRRQPAAEVILGDVPVASRVIGALGILGGILLAAAVPVGYLTVGTIDLVIGDSFAAILVSWIWPALVVASGVSVVLGHYPRMGLAALAVSGALSTAGVLGELYWASQAAERGRYEIILGRRLITSSVEPLTGWHVGMAGFAVLIVAGIATAWLWSQVVMDDSESLDPGRPLLCGVAAIGGVAAVLCLSATLVRIPDQVTVTQQIVAGQLRPVETLIPVEGAVGLFDRPGLALAASLVLGLVLVGISVFSTTLRPRLAVVGALAALTSYLLTVGGRALVEAARSEQIEATVGSWGLVLVALAFAGLVVLAWRWQPPTPPVVRGLPVSAAGQRIGTPKAQRSRVGKKSALRKS